MRLARLHEPERPGSAAGGVWWRPPDYVEAILGWRLWEIRRGHGPARLRSIYQPCVWPAGEAFRAECRSGRFRLWWKPKHVAPELECTCGVYGVPPERLPALAAEGSRLPVRFPVIGTVSLWGDVVECSNGWRASFAYPQSLFVPNWPGVEESLDELAAYGVPVRVLESRTLTDAVRQLVGAVS